MVDPSKKVPDLKCEVQDLLLEVMDLKREVSDLRSGGIPLNLTPDSYNVPSTEPVRLTQVFVMIASSRR